MKKITELNGFSRFDPLVAATVVEEDAAPFYVYDENLILQRCDECLKMPHAYGLTVRYAMNENSNKTLLKIITDAGLHVGASSLNEVSIANLAGVSYEKIMLTTQETYSGAQMQMLQSLLLQGLKYNVCSLRQLYDIGDFACKNYIEPGIRIYPDVGSVNTKTKNTVDDHSRFGVHRSDLDEALKYAWGKWIRFKHVHIHIDYGTKPEMWQQNIDLEFDIIAKKFKETKSVCLGGWLKEARMPCEKATDIEDIGNYAKAQIKAFYKKHGRKLKVEIEPGAYITANSGCTMT